MKFFEWLAGALLGERSDEGVWGKLILISMVGGVIVLLLLGYFGGGGAFGALVSLFMGAAAVSVGGLLGFLFGIPRAIQQPQQAGGGQVMYGVSYAANTNLEEISKWLTATIVGLTLVQAQPLMNGFDRLCAKLEGAFIDSSLITAPVIGLILIFFSITGAVGSYLWTRLMLTSELRRVELLAMQSPEYLEGLVQALLYQPPPKGFRSAIVRGEEYLKAFGEDNWRIYRALACAYGQEYGYLKEHNGNEEDRKAARNRALSAVKRVIELNDGERESMRALWDRTIATGQENDLVVFFDDQEFKKLFEKPTS